MTLRIKDLTFGDFSAIVPLDWFLFVAMNAEHLEQCIRKLIALGCPKVAYLSKSFKLLSFQGLKNIFRAPHFL